MATYIFHHKTWLILLMTAQLCFWYHVKDVHPVMDIVPPPPSETTVHAFTFGDEEFYFRMLALEIQNMGDTFGRFTALRDYDFERLSKWLAVLDTLNPRSNFIPTLASHYFGLTQNTPDVSYIVDYLEAHTARDPEKKWWWMAQAIYLANHKLKDKPRALKIAQKLAKVESAPIWARQMHAFIHEQLGELQEAFIIIDQLLKNEKDLSKEERYFMNHFIENRVKAMQAEEAKQKSQTTP